MPIDYAREIVYNGHVIKRGTHEGSPILPETIQRCGRAQDPIQTQEGLPKIPNITRRTTK